MKPKRHFLEHVVSMGLLYVHTHFIHIYNISVYVCVHIVIRVYIEEESHGESC